MSDTDDDRMGDDPDLISLRSQISAGGALTGGLMGSPEQPGGASHGISHDPNLAPFFAERHQQHFSNGSGGDLENRIRSQE